jgi:hypothetical protein
MSHWLDYHLLPVINSFVLMSLIIPELVRDTCHHGVTCPRWVRIKETAEDIHRSCG